MVFMKTLFSFLTTEICSLSLDTEVKQLKSLRRLSSSILVTLMKNYVASMSTISHYIDLYSVLLVELSTNNSDNEKQWLAALSAIAPVFLCKITNQKLQNDILGI
jgi:predicted hydrolase (HD superfamily)